MYRLVHGRPLCNVVLKTGSFMECVKARAVSGDLILNAEGKVVQGTGWLFYWEKQNPMCYARQMQKNGWTR